jgi:hypothetical protein
MGLGIPPRDKLQDYGSWFHHTFVRQHPGMNSGSYLHGLLALEIRAARIEKGHYLSLWPEKLKIPEHGKGRDFFRLRPTIFLSNLTETLTAARSPMLFTEINKRIRTTITDQNDPRTRAKLLILCVIRGDGFQCA